MSDYHLNKLLFDTAGRHRIVDSIADETELAANPYLIRRVFRFRFKV